MANSGPAPSLRAFVDDLAQRGWLRDVVKPVDKDWEIACIARWAAEAHRGEHAYALRFPHVIGSTVPVVLGLFATRRHIARSLGIEPDALWPLWARALDGPLEPELVEDPSAQEVVLRGEDVDLTGWPIPIWTPGRDRAPYLTTACVVTADRQHGVQNLGTYRVEVQGPRRLGLAFGSEHQHGAMHRKTWEDAGEPTPVALVVGAPPAVSYAAAAKVRYGLDELRVAGGLLGHPVPVARCETNDLLVPAESEVVIEGEIRRGERAPEGPFGEALGYMEGVGPASIVDVHCITHRRDPILHGLIQQVPPTEGHLLMEVGLLGSLWHHLTGPGKIRGLVDLAVVPGAAGVSVLAISVRAGDRESVEALKRILSRMSWGQKVTVLVDDDIDVRQPTSVLWALSSRVDFASDLTLEKDAPMFQWDPAAFQRAGGIDGRDRNRVIPGDQVVIDATLRASSLAVALPPAEAMERARRTWSETGLPPLDDTSGLERLLAHNTDEGIERGAG